MLLELQWFNLIRQFSGFFGVVPNVPNMLRSRNRRIGTLEKKSKGMGPVILLDWRASGVIWIGLDLAGLDPAVSDIWTGLD